jgi:hypothetical protein
LAIGGCGTVYNATIISTGRDVVIKVPIYKYNSATAVKESFVNEKIILEVQSLVLITTRNSKVS